MFYLMCLRYQAFNAIYFDFKLYATVNNIPRRVYRNDLLKSFTVFNTFL